MPRKANTTKAALPAEQPALTPEVRDMMIDFSMVERFVALLENSKLTELEIETGEVMLRLSKNGPAPTAGGSYMATSVANAPATVAAVPATVAVPAAPVSSKTLVEVTSPMVGTFYAAPSPDSDVYVR
ncbi:MAG: hypothetical protein OEM52_13715, partial [bacterium]|nr:hypothetical protein [bacterium]